jgi:hypothetical protein
MYETIYNTSRSHTGTAFIGMHKGYRNITDTVSGTWDSSSRQELSN